MISSDYSGKKQANRNFEKSKCITVYSDITIDEISNYKGLNNLKIIIRNVENDEEEYFIKMVSMLKMFDSFDTNYTIELECERRSILNKYIDKFVFNNIDLLIFNDSYEYQLEEFKKEDFILDCMVKNVKNSNCTPFEMFISIYDIVKNYKPYKEVDNDYELEESRSLRFILKNEYITCIGYSKLFRELLDKVGIESMIYLTSVDSSYDDGFTLENVPLDLEKHARLLVNLKDEHYNIDGFYISDPTWDNSIESDKYANMIMPFDYMQKSRQLFSLEDMDFIFDVHSMKEFNDKIKILFNKKLDHKNRKEIKSKTSRRKKYEENVLDTFFEIIHLIMDNIKHIDSEKYAEICQMWNDLLFGNNSFEDTVKYCKYFIKYISSYILRKSNNLINKTTIFKAITMAKIKTGKLLPQDYNSYIKKLSDDFEEDYAENFPYNFPDDYLEEGDNGVSLKQVTK